MTAADESDRVSWYCSQPGTAMHKYCRGWMARVAGQKGNKIRDLIPCPCKHHDGAHS